MISFYDKWEECRIERKDEKYFFKAFLEKKQESLELFYNGNEQEIANAIKLLLSIPIDEFIKYMDYENLDILPEQVLQYSSFEHGVISLCKHLYFCNPSTYNELGEKLIHAQLPGANKKYGENHSKLAQELSFVRLKREGTVKVYITNLGKMTIAMEDSDIKLLSYRLLLRNELIKKIISVLMKTDELIEYSCFTNGVLSKSTSDRRKTNVKTAINYILNNCENIYLKNRILW